MVVLLTVLFCKSMSLVTLETNVKVDHGHPSVQSPAGFHLHAYLCPPRERWKVERSLRTWVPCGLFCEPPGCPSNLAGTCLPWGLSQSSFLFPHRSLCDYSCLCFNSTTSPQKHGTAPGTCRETLLVLPNFSLVTWHLSPSHNFLLYHTYCSLTVSMHHFTALPIL